MRRLLRGAVLLSLLVAVPTAARAGSPHGETAARARSPHARTTSTTPTTSSGGIGVAGGGSTGAGQTTSTTDSTSGTGRAGTAAHVIRLPRFVSAHGHGITLTVAASGAQGRPLMITGAAPKHDASRQLEIQIARPGQTDWTNIATTQITTRGLFFATWRPPASARVALRAMLLAGVSTTTGGNSSGGSGLPGDGSAGTKATGLTTSALTIPVFRDARATIYGPGFWGQRTACGQRLRKNTLGVANRTLKCGTHVAVYYRGREIRVAVIDRGPFTGHASWDLTMATAAALGITHTAVVGTLSPTRTTGKRR